MPTPYIKKVAAETGKSVESVEADWNHAKEIVKKQYGDGEHYAIVTTVFKSIVHGKREPTNEEFSAHQPTFHHVELKDGDKVRINGRKYHVTHSVSSDSNARHGSGLKASHHLVAHKDIGKPLGDQAHHYLHVHHSGHMGVSHGLNGQEHVHHIEKLHESDESVDVANEETSKKPSTPGHADTTAPAASTYHHLLHGVLKSHGLHAAYHAVHDAHAENAVSADKHSVDGHTPNHVHHFQFFKKAHAEKARKHLIAAGLVHPRASKAKDGHLAIHHLHNQHMLFHKDSNESVDSVLDTVLNEMINKHGVSDVLDEGFGTSMAVGKHVMVGDEKMKVHKHETKVLFNSKHKTRVLQVGPDSGPTHSVYMHHDANKVHTVIGKGNDVKRVSVKPVEESVSEDMMSGDIDTGRTDDTHLVVAGTPGFASKSLKLKPNNPPGSLDLSKEKMDPYKAKKDLKLRRVASGKLGGKDHHIFTGGAGAHLIFPSTSTKKMKEAVEESMSAVHRGAIDSQTMVMRMVDAERERIKMVNRGEIPNEPRSAMHAIAEWFHSAKLYDGNACLDEWFASHYPALYAVVTSSPEGQAVDATQDKPISALGENVERVKLEEGVLSVFRDKAWHIIEQQGVAKPPELQNHHVEDPIGQPKAAREPGILKTLSIINRLTGNRKKLPHSNSTATVKSAPPVMNPKPKPTSMVPKKKIP